ncbi:5159_t:CDS:2, partial [Gigaspora rosea]
MIISRVATSSVGTLWKLKNKYHDCDKITPQKRRITKDTKDEEVKSNDWLERNRLAQHERCQQQQQAHRLL